MGNFLNDFSAQRKVIFGVIFSANCWPIFCTSHGMLRNAIVAHTQHVSHDWVLGIVV